MMTIPKVEFHKEGSGILFLVFAGKKQYSETIFCNEGPKYHHKLLDSS
jgi:hypothetical protein